MGMIYRLHDVRLEPEGRVQDLCLRDGRLEECAGALPGVEIEGNGGLLLPGMIDPHVHLRTPGMEAAENWDTGTRGATRGGVTTVLDMPNTRPPTTTQQRLAEKRALAVSARVNWGLHFGATATNLTEIAAAENIASVKAYQGSSTGDLLLDEEEALARLFRAAAAAGVPVTLHAEDEEIIRERAASLPEDADVHLHGWARPPEAAASAIKRALALAAETGATLYFCHVSTAAELDLIRPAKAAGLPISVEATPHHLFLDERDLATLGNYGKVNPPLRSPQDREALWEALLDGTVDTIGTDHAPHPREAKERPYREAPSGMPGLEVALPLLLTAVLDGRLPFSLLAPLTSERAARFFGIETAGWVLADIVSPRALAPEEIQSRCGWSPYTGRVLRGWPQYVWVNGELVLDAGAFTPRVPGREVAFRHNR
jgi:dihydroorotase